MLATRCDLISQYTSICYHHPPNDDSIGIIYNLWEKGTWINLANITVS